MNNNPKIKLFLVDDDAVLLKLLESELLKHTGFIVETYATGELCIAHLAHNPDLIVLDYHLNGIDENALNGIETLDKIKAFNADILVIMLSSQDKMEIALDCMAHKAFDYMMKNKTTYLQLPQMITTIFNYRKMRKAL
jgi:two-component system, OmpR family, response regulator